MGWPHGYRHFIWLVTGWKFILLTLNFKRPLLMAYRFLIAIGSSSQCCALAERLAKPSTVILGSEMNPGSPGRQQSYRQGWGKRALWTHRYGPHIFNTDKRRYGIAKQTGESQASMFTRWAKWGKEKCIRCPVNPLTINQFSAETFNPVRSKEIPGDPLGR